MGPGRASPRSIAEERRLVGRMRAGEESAFETFAECYIPGLYRFARRRLHDDRELTQEIVQSTLCKVIESLGSWRGEASFFTWLCACCGNEIAAHYRRAGRRPREVELDESLAEAVSSSGRLEAAELVHAALDRLPPGYARAVEWRYLEGLGVEEIARRLELTYKAAESLLSRARKAFRDAYQHLTNIHDAGESIGTSPERGVAQ